MSAATGTQDTAFTPGPWEVMPIKLTPDWAEAFDIVHGADHQVLVNDVASEADARLIAAAPELLEVLKWFCQRVDNGEVRSVRTYARFQELIAKAEGRS